MCSCIRVYNRIWVFRTWFDVLRSLLEDNCSIVVRASGVEPKLKIYASVSAKDRETAKKIEAERVKSAEQWFE